MESPQYAVVVAVHLGVELVEAQQGVLGEQPHHAVALFGKQVLQAVGVGAKGAVNGEDDLGGAGLAQALKHRRFGLGVVKPRWQGGNTAVEIPPPQVHHRKGQVQAFAGNGGGDFDLTHGKGQGPQALAAVVVLLYGVAVDGLFGVVVGKQRSHGVVGHHLLEGNAGGSDQGLVDPGPIREHLNIAGGLAQALDKFGFQGNARYFTG